LALHEALAMRVHLVTALMKYLPTCFYGWQIYIEINLMWFWR